MKALGNRKLHALIAADRALEHNALVRIPRGALDEPVTVADTLGGDQCALGIQAVENVLETLALRADEVLGRHLELVEEQLVRLVIDHVGDGAKGQSVPKAWRRSTMKSDRPSDLRLTSRQRRRAREQQHQVRVPDAGDPDLLAVDDVPIALAHGRGLEPGRVRAARRLGDRHRLQPQLAGGNRGQIRPLLRLGAVAHQHIHHVHLAVTGTGVAAAAIDLFHDDRGFGEAQARAAVLRWDQRREPPSFREGIDELGGVGALGVDFAKIFIGKFGTSARTPLRIS